MKHRAPRDPPPSPARLAPSTTSRPIGRPEMRQPPHSVTGTRSGPICSRARCGARAHHASRIHSPAGNVEVMPFARKTIGLIVDFVDALRRTDRSRSARAGRKTRRRFVRLSPTTRAATDRFPATRRPGAARRYESEARVGDERVAHAVENCPPVTTMSPVWG